jgi:predicted regulator of Ras-like GTPase activity (Roadblock/LC7/MglB family)
MDKFLLNLNKTHGIIGSAVVSSDGIPICQKLPEGYDSEAVCALSASIVSNTLKTFAQLQDENLKRALIETEHGKLFIELFSLGILVVLTLKEVNIGLIRLEMKSMINKILTSQEFGE